MLIIVFLLVLPILVYGSRIGMGETSSITGLTKIIRIIYLAFILLYCILLICERYNYYLRGYRSTSFAFLAVTIGGIIYCLLDRRPIFSSFTRIFLNIIAIVCMAGASFLLIELFDDYKKQLFYSDHRYRIEATGRGIMAPCGFPALFIKSGIIERKSLPFNLDSVFCFTKDDLYDIRIGYQDSCYVVNYYFVRDQNLKDTVPYKVQYSLP